MKSPTNVYNGDPILINPVFGLYAASNLYGYYIVRIETTVAEIFVPTLTIARRLMDDVYELELKLDANELKQDEPKPEAEALSAEIIPINFKKPKSTD